MTSTLQIDGIDVLARKRIAKRRGAVGHLCLALVGWKRAPGDCADPAGRV